MNRAIQRKSVGPGIPRSTFLSIKETAEHFGITESFVRKLIQKGDLDALKLGKRVLVKRESIERLENR